MLRAGSSTGPYHDHMPRNVEENRGIRGLERQSADYAGYASVTKGIPARPKSSPGQRRPANSPPWWGQGRTLGRSASGARFASPTNAGSPNQRWDQNSVPFSADQRFYNYTNDEDV